MKRVSTIAALTCGFVLGSWASASALATDGVAASASNFTRAAAYMGPAAPAQSIRLVVHLGYPNPTAVASFAQAVNNPMSLYYRAFITPSQFAASFAPSPATYNAVILALQGLGFQTVHTYSNRKVIDVVGTVAAADAAFHTVISTYRYNGVTYYANALPVRVPSSLHRAVMAVSGFNNYYRLQPHIMAAAFRKPAASATPAPKATLSPPYSPANIQTAYNEPVHVNPALNGTTAGGQHATIAIVTAFDYLDSDLQGFWAQFGVKRTGYTFRKFVDNPTNQGIFNAAESTETTADTEWTTSTSPGANVLVIEGRDNLLSTFDDVYANTVSDPRVDVVTTSWGLCETSWDPNELAADNDLFMQGAAEGQTWFAASGDSGSADCTDSTGLFSVTGVDAPSSSPWLGASGGTSLVLNPNATIQSEVAWPSGGGGVSVIFGLPSYQSKVPTLASTTHRNSPDVALNADPNNGYAFFYLGSGNLLQIGGTSLVAPNMAAIYAQIDGFYGHRLGQSQTGLYSLFPSKYPGTAFHDIVSGNNGAFSAHAGYDNVTGVGSLNANNYMLIIPHKGTTPL